MTAALQARAKKMRERALIRSWEYRQRRHSHGVWFRLRRCLVDAQRAFVISAEQAQALEAEGHEPLAVGRELEPRKRIFFVSEERVVALQDCREVSVALTAELLGAENLALVPHRP